MLREKAKYNIYSDEEILNLITQSKDNNLFEILRDRYYIKVTDKCMGLLKNRTLALEFADEIFSKAFDNLERLRNLASFSSWLYSITYNHCIDYLRIKKNLHYPEWDQMNDIPEIIDETEEEIADYDYDNLIKILEQVHPEEKALLLMKYQDDLSIKEISRALRISESATKMRLKRAKARVLYKYRKSFSTK
ncbi:MAG TPA: RNA polymerase sigma factor [Bacteroidales bacterium]|nr:RNA polymerase sigma factor [Bacteroidales bacterium]